MMMGMGSISSIVYMTHPSRFVQPKHTRCAPQDQWALPGGFVDENEGLDKAAARELEEETSVKPGDVVLEQVHLISAKRQATSNLFQDQFLKSVAVHTDWQKTSQLGCSCALQWVHYWVQYF